MVTLSGLRFFSARRPISKKMTKGEVKGLAKMKARKNSINIRGDCVPTPVARGGIRG